MPPPWIETLVAGSYIDGDSKTHGFLFTEREFAGIPPVVDEIQLP